MHWHTFLKRREGSPRILAWATHPRAAGEGDRSQTLAPERNRRSPVAEAPNLPRTAGTVFWVLVGTSANMTGHSPAESGEEIVKILGDRVDLVLDGGKSPLGVSSTVVDLTKDRS